MLTPDFSMGRFKIQASRLPAIKQTIIASISAVRHLIRTQRKSSRCSRKDFTSPPPSSSSGRTSSFNSPMTTESEKRNQTFGAGLAVEWAASGDWISAETGSVFKGAEIFLGGGAE